MDTVIYPIAPRQNIDKLTTSVTGIGIALCLLISQNSLISAKDLEVGTYTGLSPTLNYIQENNKLEEKFDNELANKYAGSKITKVDKGIKHVKMIRFYNNKPVRINIVELSTGVNSDLEVLPVTASNDRLSSRSKISNIAQRENAIVAINGGYFKPQTGVPLGTLMINKKVYTGPIYDRVAMGFFDNGYAMARVQLKANVNTNIGGLKVDNVNQPRMLSTHVLAYTPDWGKTSPACPKYGKAIAISDGKLIASSYGALDIPADGFVIVGPEKNLDTIINAKNYSLDIKINPEWKGVNHIISGGPYLVKGGEVYVDMTAQKLAAIGGRNPRTAIGYTKDKHLIMLTADGREGASVGLTLNELAHLMKELGCVYAMNLDGGGSTVMYVNGQVVNRPPVQGGIPLSHTLTVTQKRYS